MYTVMFLKTINNTHAYQVDLLLTASQNIILTKHCVICFHTERAKPVDMGTHEGIETKEAQDKKR